MLSHWHWDHSFGMCALDIPVIASELSNVKLKELAHLRWDKKSVLERVDKGTEILFCAHMMEIEFNGFQNINIRPADIIFKKQLTIDLGGITCCLICAGGPHSED